MASTTQYLNITLTTDQYLQTKSVLVKIITHNLRCNNDIIIPSSIKDQTMILIDYMQPVGVPQTESLKQRLFHKSFQTNQLHCKRKVNLELAWPIFLSIE